VGEVTVTVVVAGDEVGVSMIASEHVMEIILGLDWLQKMGAIWNFQASEVLLRGKYYSLESKNAVKWCRRVVCTESIMVPPRTEMMIPTKVVSHRLNVAGPQPYTCWATLPKMSSHGLHIPSIFMNDDQWDMSVRVVNTSRQDISVAVGESLTTLQGVDVVKQSTSAEGMRNNHLDDTVIQDMMRGIPDEVSETDREKLIELLQRHVSAFAMSETDLGRTDIVKHRIETGDAIPVRQPLRRQPPAHLDAIQKHVSSMLKQDVIRPSDSPWASNIVLVRKKDNTLRCCIDYRQVNNLSRKDAYPLPRIDVCLDALAGSAWYSTFDLKNSFHQIEMDSASAEKTAFLCKEGLFQYNTMPFGLSNSGATFQRAMDIILSGLSYDICLAYLDDIIIYSASIEEQLERLDIVLARIGQVGLKLKPSKCHLMRREVIFLGHVVTANGIATDPEKTQKVREWPPLTDIRDVRAFLGLCSYYRRFIMSFAEIASPLTDLTRKNARFVWSEACQKAFDTLKDSLVSAPILGLPSDNG